MSGTPWEKQQLPLKENFFKALYNDERCFHKTSVVYSESMSAGMFGTSLDAFFTYVRRICKVDAFSFRDKHLLVFTQRQVSAKDPGGITKVVENTTLKIANSSRNP